MSIAMNFASESFYYAYFDKIAIKYLRNYYGRREQKQFSSAENQQQNERRVTKFSGQNRSKFNNLYLSYLSRENREKYKKRLILSQYFQYSKTLLKIFLSNIIAYFQYIFILQEYDMSTQPHNFTHQQSKKLTKLFDRFYELSRKVMLTAKTTQMAIASQEHTNATINNLDIELAFEVILNDIEYINQESSELASVPDYLFWDDKHKNKYEWSIR